MEHRLTETAGGRGRVPRLATVDGTGQRLDQPVLAAPWQGQAGGGIAVPAAAVEIEEGLPEELGSGLATLAHALLVNGEVEPGLAAAAEARREDGTGRLT